MLNFLRKLKSRKKFFFRLIMSHALISILPMLILGFILSSYISRTFVNNAIASGESTLEAVNDRLGLELTQYFTLARTIANHSDTWEFSNQQLYGQLPTTRLMQYLEYLRSVLTFNSDVRSIYIYRNNQIISTEGVLSADNFIEIEWLRGVLEQARAGFTPVFSPHFVTDSRDPQVHPRHVNPDFSRTFSIIFPIGGRSYVNGMFALNIHESHIIQILDASKGSEHNVFVVYNKKTQNLAFTSTNNSLFEEINLAELIEALVYDTGTYGPVNIGGNTAHMLRKDTMFDVYTVFYFMDLGPIQAQARSAFNLSLFYMLILMGIGLVGALLISGGIYSPIRALVRGVAIGKSPYDSDEIKLISDHINTIHVENDDNRKIIFEALPVLKGSIIGAMLRGRVASEDDLAKRLKLCDMSFELPLNTVAVLSIDDYEDYVSEYDLSIRLNYEVQLQQTIVELFREEGCNVYIRGTQEYMEMIINHGADGYEKKIFDCFQRIKDDQAIYTGITFSVGISKAYDNINLLPGAYREAMDAMAERFSAGGNSILLYGDVSDEHSSFFFHIQSEDKLLATLMAGDKDSVSALVSEIFDLAVEKGMRRINMMQISLEILGYVRRYLFRKGVGASNCGFIEKYDSMSVSLYDSQSHKDMQNKLMEVLLLSADFLQQTSGEGKSKIAEKIKAFIEENYVRDISLTELADYVRLSPSYISIVFYKEFNVNYHNYLNNLRIEKAKDLLANSDTPITEIAEAIGFTNYNTFSRAFKKAVGVSAKQFRMGS